MDYHLLSTRDLCHLCHLPVPGPLTGIILQCPFKWNYLAGYVWAWSCFLCCFRVCQMFPLDLISSHWTSKHLEHLLTNEYRIKRTIFLHEKLRSRLQILAHPTVHCFYSIFDLLLLVRRDPTWEFIILNQCRWSCLGSYSGRTIHHILSSGPTSPPGGALTCQSGTLT